MCNGDEFFYELTSCLGFQIPTDIKKILQFNYYNEAITLSKFDDNSIKEIEQVMRFIFKENMVAPTESTSDYLCRFTNDQTNFQFIGGQIKIIRMIAEYCRNIYQDDNIASILSQPTSSSAVREHATTVVLSHENICQQNVDDVTQLFKRIGSQMITVYNDAKRATLSAWSWPSRQVALALSNQFETNGHLRNVNINFRYLTPSHHADLLHSIVQVDLPNIKTRIANALAISLRVDGSVDRTQNHNIYVMAHLVATDLTVETLFLGFSIPKSGGNASSYFQAVKDSVANIVEWEQLFQQITSLVTDGENLNTGCDNSLWTKMKDDRRTSINNQQPLLLIWCVVHRLNLAWKTLCKEVPIIAGLIEHAKHLSAHFHGSGERTQKLKNISASNPLEFQKFLQYPAYFEIRWAEFTHSLFTAILRNWNASIHYFESTNEVGLKNRWINYDLIHLLTFLTDVLSLFKAFQKSCESDSILFAEVVSKKNNFFAKLDELKSDPLVDGWEHFFLTHLNKEDSSFHGHKLTNPNRRSCVVTESFDTTQRSIIIDRLVYYINERLNVDLSTQDLLQPLLKITNQTSIESLKLCHSLIVPDFNENDFIAEYFTAAELLKKELHEDNLQNLNLLSTCDLKVFKTGLARAIAAKPHSADVERLIHVYNTFKDVDRSSMSPTSLFNYLYVNVNMGTLERFDPATAATLWVNSKQRRPHSKTTTKAKQQEWFLGVFEDADKVDRKAKTSHIIF